MIRVSFLADGKLVQGGAELIAEARARSAHYWVDIQGDNRDDYNHILEQHNIHPLAAQDAHRPRHPPKLEFFDDHFFVVLRGVAALRDDLDLDYLQVSYFVGKQYLITYHQRHSLSIDQSWDNPAVTSLLANGGEAVFFSITNTMGLNYIQMMLDFEERLSEYDDDLESIMNDDALQELINFRTRLRKLLRVQSYHETVFDELYGWTEHNASAEMHHLCNDSYDKFERLHSMSQLYYDVAGDLVDGHYSLAAHKLNDTMRVLTVLTAIFVPLGFLAGLYGMNFDNMPELHNPNGYYILLSVMITIVVVLLAIFKRKRWL